MAKSLRWNYASLVKRLGDDFDRPESRFAETRNRLAQLLDEAEIDLEILSIRMRVYSKDLYARGIVRICGQQNAEGWNNLYNGFLCSLWHCRLDGTSVDERWAERANDPTVDFFFPSSDLEDMTFCVLAGMAFREWDLAAPLGNWMLQPCLKHNYMDSGSEVEPISALALAIHSRRWTLDFHDTDTQLGPYHEIMSGWTGAWSGSELSALCDFHCKNVRSESHAFVDYPFNVWPLEISAICRVRESLGLPTPQVDHPLLSSPLFDVPQIVSKNEDSVLRKAIDRILEMRPEVAGLGAR